MAISEKGYHASVHVGVGWARKKVKVKVNFKVNRRNEVEMKIGELARRTGLSASRIRFYEASGLIAARRLGNGYRDYPEQMVRALEVITCGQQAGFSLEEMRKLGDASGAEEGGHGVLLASLKRKVAEIEAMQQRLAQNRAQLLAVIAGIEDKPQGMDCEANAQRLIAGWQDQDGKTQPR